VVDENGREKYDPHSEGELQILAPHPMLGYLNNDLANREVFHEDEKGRWINSGDIGYIDEGAQVFIVDRKKDLIKVRGWQVSPAEVESCIQGHPEVIDVGVIGIQLPDDSGEAVCAYVVRHCDRFVSNVSIICWYTDIRCSVLTAEELRSFTSSSLANFKCPRDIIFTENVPRNPTGKILRRLIRDQAVPAIPIASLTTSTWLLAAAALAVSSCLVSKLATINIFLRWL
jgi:acyl-CoA synthetase (AMP-forming)/AMP-acid ligase II